MTWDKLAFLHWRVDAEKITSLIPAALELDTFDGEAWLAVVPFIMDDVGARGLPGFPTTGRFLELNVRTYVKCDGRPGVCFFSLDAESWLAVRGARAGFHLPYFDADMRMSVTDDVAYCSRRIHHDAPAAKFRAIYEPTGVSFRARFGSLEHFLAERYCLYAWDKRERIYRGEIHHGPWPLQSAKVAVRENTMGEQIGIELNPIPDHVLYAERIEVVAWAPVCVRS